MQGAGAGSTGSGGAKRGGTRRGGAGSGGGARRGGSRTDSRSSGWALSGHQPSVTLLIGEGPPGSGQNRPLADHLGLHPDVHMASPQN